MNKIAGLVGGTGPESTIEYYKQIIARWRERVTDGSYPALVITAGAWTSQLLRRWPVKLQVTRQVLGWVWPKTPEANWCDVQVALKRSEMCP